MPMPVALRVRRILGSTALAMLVAGVAGCASAPPAVPPTELSDISASVTLARRWAARVEEAGRGRFEPWVDAERVVVADGEGLVTAFDRASGRRLWQTDLDTPLASGVGAGTAGGVGGLAEALYLGSEDGTVYALEPGSGEQRWNVQASSEVRVAPIGAFGAVIVRSVDGRVVVLEPDDGSERWSVSNTPPALTVAGYSKPLPLDGGVLVGLDDGRVIAFALDTGRVIWESVLSLPSGRSEVERLVDVDADLLVDDAGIYVVNYQGRAAQLEPARGQAVWSVPLSSTAGLSIAGERLVVVDDEDVLHGLERETGRELWTSRELRGRQLSPPLAVDEETFLVGDFEGYLHVISLIDGSVIGRSRPAREAISARPVLNDGNVIVTGEDGRISVFDIAR